MALNHVLPVRGTEGMWMRQYPSFFTLLSASSEPYSYLLQEGTEWREAKLNVCLRQFRRIRHDVSRGMFVPRQKEQARAGCPDTAEKITSLGANSYRLEIGLLSVEVFARNSPRSQDVKARGTNPCTAVATGVAGNTGGCWPQA